MRQASPFAGDGEKSARPAERGDKAVSYTHLDVYKRQIIQIMNVNIYDSNVSGYLRFCYSLMIDDYPIDKK